MKTLRLHYWTLGLIILPFIIMPGPRAWADAHDDAVFQRYSRKVTPGKIQYEFGMKFKELTRPATQQDVEKGSAVFTFEGLGPSRVWKLPECPNFCDWPSLKDYPFPGQNGLARTNFNDFGYVCQAEELQINGQWKRYFGFVCEHGSAVVPAEEIAIWAYCNCDSPSPIAWNRLPEGMNWGMLGPATNATSRLTRPVIPNVGAPLPVEVYLRNDLGAAHRVLGDIYHDGSNGGPAFRQGITLTLQWAPFDAKTADKEYPRFDDFKPLSAIRANSFIPSKVGPVLETGEKARLAVFDLRDWFDLTVPGYYRYRFEFNLDDLGLATDTQNCANVYVGFALGSEPRRATVEELNRDIPALGGPQNEAKIREIIKQGIKNGNNSTASESSTRSGHTRPIPNRLPELNYKPFMGDNMSGEESDVVQLGIPNGDWLKSLELYDRDEVRARLEALMQKEKVLPMKLLLASEAITRGSEAAALFLLECMKTTDYTVARDTQDTLRLALAHYQKNPPDWLVAMVIAALSDERQATGLGYRGFSSPTLSTLLSIADREGGLAEALGDQKCTNAVPFLMALAKKDDGGFGAISALGEIGDARAVPLLIDFVRQKDPSGQPARCFWASVESLGNLHATEAVPVLLEYIEQLPVIEALEQIGDARAVEPLRQLVASKGKIEKTGVENDPKDMQERLAAARIALASLDPDDRIARLCELLTDASLGEFQRRSVEWCLGRRPDPRAIPFLAKAVKSDPSGAVVNQGIAVLAEFKYKETVDVLIDAFDADFQGKHDWKRAYTPQMFRDNIADALHSLTGQKLGAEKAQWLKWWKEHRDTVPGLK
jgi:HEAT repeat protein